MNQILKDKNIIIDGVEGTGKTTLITALKRLYPFCVFKGSNYVHNKKYIDKKMFELINKSQNCLFDRGFISSYIITKEKYYLDMLNKITNDNLIYIMLINNKLDERIDSNKMKKFIYKKYSKEEIQTIQSKMVEVFKDLNIKNKILLNTTEYSVEDIIKHLLIELKYINVGDE